MLASLANDINLLQIGFKQRGSLDHFLLNLDSATKTFVFLASPVDYVVLLQTGFEQLEYDAASGIIKVMICF